MAAAGNVPFALNPADALNGVIDFLSASGAKLYRSATHKLSDEPFDCSSDRFQTFLDQIDDRCTRYGWINNILHIHTDGHQQGPEVYLVHNYGQLTIERVREHVITYLFGQTRETQDDSMLYYCLKESLSEEAKGKILACKEDYMVTNPANVDIAKPSGVLLLKVIIRESHVDTNATSMTIRLLLSQLDQYMVTVGSDIDKFNQYVALKVQMLRARGESSTDLLTNLFKAYNAAQDPEFVKYIRMKESEYEDGATYTVVQLMGLALNKYKSLKQKKLWMAPTPTEERIMALEVVQQKQAADKARKRKAAATTPSRDRQRQRTNARLPPPFLNEKPEEGKEKAPRKWEDKNWWYCHETTGGKCPGKWRTHKPQQCKWDQIIAKAKKNQARDNAPKLTRAYQAVIDHEDNDDNSSEDDNMSE